MEKGGDNEDKSNKKRPLPLDSRRFFHIVNLLKPCSERYDVAIGVEFEGDIS